MTKEYLAQITNFSFDAQSILGKLDTTALFVAGVILVAFLVLSMALDHHWKNYGVTKKQIKHLRQVYFGVSGLFLAGMIAGLLVSLLS
ncbi:MAG: hypothetical protein R3251_03200 [Candidatus Spechtbacterales bacterium]|nr:hypothetical protein [Candidatus Spechtbacterales bacterium]